MTKLRQIEIKLEELDALILTMRKCTKRASLEIRRDALKKEYVALYARLEEDHA